MIQNIIAISIIIIAVAAAIIITYRRIKKRRKENRCTSCSLNSEDCPLHDLKNRKKDNDNCELYKEQG